VLGLAGESGTLATTLKKKLRDGDSYALYADHVKEELGDVMWYVAVLASKFSLDLGDVAKFNLAKIRSRYRGTADSKRRRKFHDSGFPREQRIPRRFTVRFEEVEEPDGKMRVTVSCAGRSIGGMLRDNSYVQDGYRFHDVFHLAYAACLGWSPVLRELLNCKRSKHAVVDEVEDGGRAIVIEEGIAAFVFGHASKHKFLEGLTSLDFDVLKVVKDMTSGLEVSDASWRDWEVAILEGYKLFRILMRQRSGFVTVDLNQRSLTYKRLRN
jgi:NTP pyrophosphatase (non-canonical NTP hydrolase)